MIINTLPLAGGAPTVEALFVASVGDAGRNERPLARAVMHYPHRTSRIKRKRAIGFRARMKTKNGRKMMNRKRAVGRSLNVADK